MNEQQETTTFNLDKVGQQTKTTSEKRLNRSPNKDLSSSIPLTNKALALFYQVAINISEIRQLNDLLSNILGSTTNAFGIEGVSIALHDTKQHELYFIRTIEEGRDGQDKRKEAMRFGDSIGIGGWVLHEGKPALVPDVSKDSRFFNGMDGEHFKTRSMICIPLKTRRSTIGVLYALNKIKGAFDQNDVETLKIVGGPIAIAIENALLYEKLEFRARVLEQENQRLKSEVCDSFGFYEVVGSSLSMRHIFRMIKKILNTCTTVLIQGETGTGKELIAKVIHYNGFLKDKPFVAENCGALSENLLESELFGHVKGAFTGAISNKKGLFEQADGGTIFLDEISEMPPSMQVKLLRVLQEGQIRPVGSSHTINVNVRLIACTNRHLETEVEKGKFREDLFYRINVFPITMPALRERKEDIPLLVTHFLKKFSRRFKSSQSSITPYALELLIKYNWPGNVRELQNEIERAMAMAGPDHPITALELSDRVKPQITCRPNNHCGETLSEVVERIEIQMITEALSKYKGNRTQAARSLGLTRQGLLNKINRYVIKM
jgi:transcriptional regulator with GAF, ATPase, and Fis domain